MTELPPDDGPHLTAPPDEPPAPDGDAVAVARGLTAAVTGLAGRVAELAEFGHRNRRMIWGLIFSVALDVLLTIGFALVLGVAVHASNRSENAAAVAGQTRTSQLVTCQSSNQARAQNKQLWDFLIALSRPPANAIPQQVAADRALLAKITSRVDVTFAPRDCARLYGGKP